LVANKKLDAVKINNKYERPECYTNLLVISFSQFVKDLPEVLSTIKIKANEIQILINRLAGL